MCDSGVDREKKHHHAVWYLAHHTLAMASKRIDEQDGMYQPGDVVLTTYGAGVIVEIKENFYTVRLWRQIGKSISSAASARLNQTSIIRKIPAAPGMTTSIVAGSPNKQNVLVVAFLQQNARTHQDSFLVSYVADEAVIGNARQSCIGEIWGYDHNQLVSVESTNLNGAPSAKFYPLLETLIQRADDTYHAATGVLKNERTKAIVMQTGKVLQTKINGASETLADHRGIGNRPSSVAASIEAAMTSATVGETTKEVVQLVKNEDFIDLLATCRSRLSEMTNAQGISALSQQTLSKSAIYFNAESLPSSFMAAVDISRKAALTSLEELLHELEIESNDLEAFQTAISSRFEQAFDSLSSAAKSDDSLNSLFTKVQEKTRDWQDVTGRLKGTRSAGLFAEGAGRLHQRAAAILGPGNLQWAGGVGATLTKSLTEGDAALARLKSIELADAVAERLGKAIEVRSEVVGGLDGIIASALSQLREGTIYPNSTIQRVLSSLQHGASSAAVESHETLLSLLSSQSAYRDGALLQIERVLCGLSDQFGESLSPNDISKIARGDGGTAKLFEPICKQALLQIDTQLNLAESSISDATALGVLRKVRKITSGDLSLSSILDDLVNVLNDKSFVQASETFVQRSEQVLDFIEGVSANQALDDALKLAERAGITKTSVIEELENVDINDLLSTAGNAVTDESARHNLLSTATDTALDFVLRILPSIKFPPFEGVNDGLIYHISNLSMKGFKVKKEDIHIELAGMNATRIRRTNSANLSSPNKNGKVESHGRVKSTEVLIIDIQNISAVLEDAQWNFEQTYMPYLKAHGLANIRFHGGAIRLQFELRRQRTESNPPIWEPVLCLHDRQCTISEVDLTLQGESRLAWILNKAASVFKGPLRDYIVRTVSYMLVSQSGWILQRMNSLLSAHWGLILQTAGLKMSDLVAADERVVSKESLQKEQTYFELVWRDHLPLGINLLLNDESGFLKVVDFPRGSQARVVCERKRLDPDTFKGSRIVAVNGSQHGGDLEDLFAALKEPGRPKTIRFEVANQQEAQRVRTFVLGNDEVPPYKKSTAHETVSYELRDLLLSALDSVGIAFCRSLDDGLVVESFLEGDGGVVLAAERSHLVSVGDLLVKINNTFVSSFADALNTLEAADQHRPMTLSFADPYLHSKEILRPIDGAGGGDELTLSRKGKKIIISGFKNISGKAERSGIMIGDFLVFVNGHAVGAGCRWLDIQPMPTLAEVKRMIVEQAAHPMGLTFARPTRERDTLGLFRDDEAETICVTLDRPDELGCVIQQTKTHDIVVADFQGVPGNLQTALRPFATGLSIQAINGQALPSYASEEMVKSAISRSWKVDGKVELWLCNDQLKDWLQNHGKEVVTNK
ncbi:hypothetical protein MPSEU_000474900 [Mayamaea pseudoterrestris]|nr:hypothetical protein MPSEU_000474900 [Mayamaea pseudoterrestris]